VEELEAGLVEWVGGRVVERVDAGLEAGLGEEIQVEEVDRMLVGEG
jgi:hypothetical protein